MKTLLTGLALALLLTAPGAWALTGDEVLARVERAMNAPKDRIATERMQLIRSDGSTKARTIELYQKGDNERLIVFRTPADVKGVGFLSLGHDRLYLYLPAFRKVRRIASSARNEAFVGTDFSYEDLAETRYTEDFTATLENQRERKFELALTPKPGADVSYARERMWVDAHTFIPVRAEFYDEHGTLLKVLSAEQVEKIDGYWVPRRMTMQTIRDGHKTVMELDRVKHDSGLPDSFFTERNLKKLGR